MKRVWIVASVIAIFLFVFGGLQIRASQSDYYRMDKALCEKYVEMSQEALQNNDLYSAKLYAQKAVQANPWSKKAWNNYNMVIVKITGGNPDITLEPKKEEAEMPQEAPSAEGEGEEIEGC